MRSCAMCANEHGHWASLHSRGQRAAGSSGRLHEKREGAAVPSPRKIGNRVQLLVDDWLVQSHQNVLRFLDPPTSQVPVLHPTSDVKPKAKATRNTISIAKSNDSKAARSGTDWHGSTAAASKDTRFGCPCSALAAPDGGVWLWHAATPHGPRLRLASHPSECRATDDRCFKPDEHAIVRRWSPDGHRNWSAPTTIRLAGKPKLRTFWVGGSPTALAAPAAAPGALQSLVAGYEGIWGVACLAGSSDGEVSWHNLAVPSDRAARPLPSSDSAIAVCARQEPSYLKRAADAYVSPVADGHGKELVYYRKDFGTAAGWREIRGMQVVSLSRSFASLERSTATGSGDGSDGGGSSGGCGGGGEDGSSSTKRVVHNEWYLDRLGKLERFRRQLYSLALAPIERASPDGGGSAPSTSDDPGEEASVSWIGVAVVLEWPKDTFAEPLGPNLAAFARDTTNVYLVTSRDGVHVDHSWIYAHRPLLPKGSKRQEEWDAGFLLPAPHFVTHASMLSGKAAAFRGSSPDVATQQHTLFFEARAGNLHHEERFNGPATIGRASWPAHRIVGLRAAVLGCPAHMLTKALDATSHATSHQQRSAKPLRQRLHVALSEESAQLRVEMICARTGRTPAGFDAAHSVVTAARPTGSMQRVMWIDESTGTKRDVESNLCPESLLQLRFELEGAVRLYAFQIR